MKLLSKEIGSDYMDMYQKRKVRKEKSANEIEENSKMNINWVMLFYGNTSKNVEISSFL